MSTLQVDRIEPYQSASVTIVGLDIDTTALNNFTASQESLNGTFATTGSNTFVGNQTVTGYVAETFNTPGDNEQTDLITLSGATVTGTPFNVATFGVQDYGGDAFQDIFAMEFADSYSYNYYNSFYLNGKATTFNLSLSGSGGGVGGTFRMRPNTDDATKVDTSIWGNKLYLASNTEKSTIFSPSGVDISGSVSVSGSVTQNFPSPIQNEENAFVNVSGTSISGIPYNRVYFGIADYSQFGAAFEDYFSIEYYDSLSYNYGSELDVNGKQIQLITLASGSGQTSYVRTTDNYDGTSQVSIGSPNKIAINGKVELSDVLQLAPQDPLPGGGTGQLAVSGSNLYYHNGSNWSQIN